MVATLADNARRLGLEVKTARADAESLPFSDESFAHKFQLAELEYLAESQAAQHAFAENYVGLKFC